jgi:hypothetical protein
VVLEELTYNARKYRSRVEELLRRYKPLVLLQTTEADDLAQAYVENAFPRRARHDVLVDAMHAAIATTANITYMAAYNYRNLLNVKVLAHLNAVNLIAGYNRQLAILPPFMFLELDNYDGEKGTVDDAVWRLKSRYGRKLEALLRTPAPKRRRHYETVVTKGARNLGLQVVRLTDMLG